MEPSCPRPPGGCDNHLGSKVGEARSYLIMTDRPLEYASWGQYRCRCFPVSDRRQTNSIRRQYFELARFCRKCEAELSRWLCFPVAMCISAQSGKALTCPTELRSNVFSDRPNYISWCLDSQAEPLNASQCTRRDALVIALKSKSSPFRSLSITTVHQHHG